MSGTGHEGPSVIEQLAAYVTGEALDRLPAARVGAARRAIRRAQPHRRSMMRLGLRKPDG